MGFRNPVTTAEAVDTRTTSTGPGARLYQTTGPGYAGGTVELGVLELTSGVKGEMPATLEMQSTPDASGNSTGVNVTLYGSDSQVPGNVIQAPRLDLLTGPDANPAVWESTAHLQATTKIRLDAPSVFTKPLYDYDSGRAIDRVMEIVEPAAGSYATGWAPLGAGGYEGLQFVRTRDGMITVSGVVKYNGGTGASLTIFALSGVYRPRSLHSHILGANVADTFRGVDVNSTGLVLRGALPTAGQFVSINGTYPGTLVT